MGNKWANLQVLEGVVAAAGLQQAVDVPAYSGMTSPDLWAHLRHKGEPSLRDRERGLQRSLAECRGQLTPAVQQALRSMRQQVGDLLRRWPPPLDTAWLAGSSGPLMVRSSAEVDGDRLANVGGNLSVANVPAQPGQPLTDAIAAVVSSYWSEQSWGQRLVAGDDMGRRPCIAVLLQRMVAERSPSDLYTSGILYTHEVEGNTPGYSSVHATFGHLAHPQRAQLQAVVIATAANASSHEAATLRASHMPVVQVEALAAVRELVREAAPLLLDPAQGLLLGAATLRRDLEPLTLKALAARGAIVSGWAAHPLPAELSLSTAPTAPPIGTLLPLYRQLVNDAGITLAAPAPTWSLTQWSRGSAWPP